MRAERGWFAPGHVVEDPCIALRGDRISWLGSWTDRPADAPDSVRRRPGFLTPGIADDHVHLSLGDPRATLAGGVTAVRDLACPLDAALPLRADAQKGPGTLPAVRIAGPMITAIGGYPMRAAWAAQGTGVEVRDAAAAAALVRRLVEAGVDLIKVSLNADAGPALDDGALRAVVETARSAGLEVTAHAQGAGQVRRAMATGVDELAHAPWSERLDDAVVEALARSTRIVSTLDIHGWGAEDPDLSVAIDNLTRFRAAGGTIRYGTDLGNGPIPSGVDAREVDHLRSVGLRGDALLAAMVASPLEEGGRADLVIWEHDPTEAGRGGWPAPLLVIGRGRVVGPDDSLGGD